MNLPTLNFQFDPQVNQYDQMAKGAQYMQAMQQIRDQYEQRQKALELEKQRQIVLEDFYGKKNVTPDDILRVSAVLPKETLDAVKFAWEQKSKEARQSDLSMASQVLAALSAKKADIAEKILIDRATAYRNAGDEQNAMSYETWANIARTSPEDAIKSIGIMISALPDGKEVLESSTKALSIPLSLRKEEIEANLKEAETRDLNSQIAKRASDAYVDRQKLAQEAVSRVEKLKSEGKKLTPDSIKLVNASVINASDADQRASRYADLADRYDSAKKRSGFFASFSETLKEVAGSEDAATALKNDYIRVKNAEAIKSLPPGPATDKDIAIAMKGMPKENANPTEIASFLRGLSKMKQYEAGYENAKADWLSENGNLGRLKEDVVINGKVVSKGASFQDYIKVAVKVKEVTPKPKKAQDQNKTPQTQNNRGFMNYAK